MHTQTKPNKHGKKIAMATMMILVMKELLFIIPFVSFIYMAGAIFASGILGNQDIENAELSKTYTGAMIELSGIGEGLETNVETELGILYKKTFEDESFIAIGTHGTGKDGDIFYIEMVSSNRYNTPTTTTLVVGEDSGTWTITTQPIPEIVHKYFDEGTKYGRYRGQEISCDLNTMPVVIVNDTDVDYMVQTEGSWTGNSIYVLTEGDYTIPNAINLSGCTALIGEGQVKVYGETNMGSTIIANEKEYIIIENIEIDGYNDGNGGQHERNNGLSLSNVQNSTIYNTIIHGTLNGIELIGGGGNYIDISKIYNQSNNAISIVNSSSNTINRAHIYNSEQRGLLIQNGWNNKINNLLVYNGSNYGVVIENTQNTSLNNAQIFNNGGYGLYSSSSSQYTIINNTYFYNNGNAALYFDNSHNNILSNVTFINNGSVLYGRGNNNVYYNTIEVQGNEDNALNINQGSASDEIVAGLGREDGTINTTKYAYCEIVADATTDGIGLQRNSCTSRGKNHDWNPQTPAVYYYLGNKQGLQETPVQWNGGTIGQANIPFESQLGVATILANIAFIDRYETQTQTSVYITSNEVIGYTIEGDFLESPIVGNAAGEQTVTLTEGLGEKSITMVVESEGYLPQYYVAKTARVNPQVLYYFGPESSYNKNWNANTCNMANMTITEIQNNTDLQSLIGTHGYVFPGQTVYNFSSGTYEIAEQMYFDDCLAIVGSGNVVFHSNGRQDKMFSLYNRKNVIIDNIKINGEFNRDGNSHGANNFGLYLNNTIDSTFSNLTIYNNQHGIKWESASNNNLLFDSILYNNNVGIDISTSTKTIINNVQSFNNSEVGIRLQRGSFAAINNTQSYNNGVGIANNNNNSSIFNNIMTYNNNQNGMSFENTDGNKMHKIWSFNNGGYGIYNARGNLRYYGENILFDNIGGNIQGESIQGNEGERSGWGIGNMVEDTLETNCALITNPLNQDGIFLQSGAESCNSIGKVQWVNTGETYYLYGGQEIKQVQPYIAYPVPLAIELGRNSLQYLGQTNPLINGNIEIDQEGTVTTMRSIQLIISADEGVNFELSGDFIESPLYGQVNGTSWLDITLTQNFGTKNITYKIYTGEIERTFQASIVYLDTNSALYKYYGPESTYTTYWEQNPCVLGDMQIEEISDNDSWNTLLTQENYVLPENRMYILASGNYIVPTQVQINSCSALIGSGIVNIYTTESLGQMLSIINSQGIIVDHVRLDGDDRGDGSTYTQNIYNIYVDGVNNSTFAHIILQDAQDGMYISNSDWNQLKNITVANNSNVGLSLVQSSDNNTISNIVGTNNNYGVRINFGQKNTIHNSMIYNNNNDGIVIENNASLNTINNSNIFNNQGAGLYQNGGEKNIYNNLHIFNNGGNGITLDASQNILHNIYVYNNEGQGVGGWSTENTYYGAFKIFDNGGGNGVNYGNGNEEDVEISNIAWGNGTITSTDTMSCLWGVNAINVLGNVSIQGTNKLCDTRGRVGLTRVEPIYYMFGYNITKQENVAQRDQNNTMIETKNIVIEDNIPIGAQRASIQMARYTSTENIEIALTSTTGIDYVLAGDFEESPVAGSLNGEESKIITLQNDVGEKKVFFTVTTNNNDSIYYMQSIDLIDPVALRYFGPNSPYTQNRPNNTCELSSFQTKTFVNNTERNTYATQRNYVLEQNTIYILDTGEYTINQPITMASCTAILGSGSVRIQANGRMSYIIGQSNSSQTIIENIHIDNQRLDTTDKIQYGIYIENVQKATYSGLFVTNAQVANIYGTNADDVKIQNTEISQGSIGIRMEGGSDNLIIQNTQSFGNQQQGIWLQDSQNGIVHNVQSYNNDVGIQTQRANNTTINNTQLYNNTVGLYNQSSTNSIINNNNIYNNQGNGVYTTIDMIFHNVNIYNNGEYGLYNESGRQKFYGNNRLFSNNTNALDTEMLLMGGEEMSQVEFLPGEINETEQEISCLRTANPINEASESLLDTASNCSEIGRKLNRSGTNIRYVYGQNLPKQTKPIRFGPAFSTLSRSPNAYIAESNPTINATVNINNGVSYTTEANIQILLETTETAQYMISGDIVDGPIMGVLSTSGSETISLTEGFGPKTIIVSYSTGSKTRTFTNIVYYINPDSPITKLFGPENTYTTHRSGNVCAIEDMQEVTIENQNDFDDILTNQNGRLNENTVYVLQPGTYTINREIQLNNCTVLVGSGDTIITTDRYQGAQITISNKYNNIIENITLRGKSDETTEKGIWFSNSKNTTLRELQISRASVGIHMQSSENIDIGALQIEGNNHQGNGIYGNQVTNIRLQNTQIFNTQQGIYIQGGFGNIEINNIQTFNNTSNGITLQGGDALSINNTQSYNNGQHGVYTNGFGEVLINNVHIYNNASYGLALQQTYDTIIGNNLHIYNNNYGIYNEGETIYVYGENKITNNQNAIYGPFGLGTGGIYPSLLSGGTLYTGNQTISCDRTSNPKNQEGIYLQNQAENCTTTGVVLSWRAGISGYIYGANIALQNKPITRDQTNNLTFSDTLGWNGSNYIAEIYPLFNAYIGFYPTSTIVESRDTQARIVVTGTGDYVITGDFVEAPLMGTIYGEDQLSITLTEGYGNKTLYASFTQGEYNIQRQTTILYRDSNSVCPTITDVPREECEALEDIYNTMGGEDWSAKANWMGFGDESIQSLCDREGINCNGGHIDYISLNNKQLIGALPSSIGNLTHLRELHLPANRITSLPERIGELLALETLVIKNNQIVELPRSIGSLTGLRILEANANQIIALPDTIGNLQALQTLDISRNPITEIPASISGMTNLSILNLSETNITSLPANIGELQYLTELHANRIGLTSLPESIGNLSYLRYIDITFNNITYLPESIGGLSRMTHFYAMYNDITALPESVYGWREIEEIGLRYNKLLTLPRGVSGWTNLEYLDVRGNRIVSLPEEVWHLKKLWMFRINDNHLTSIPQTLVGMTGLSNGDGLNIHHNCIEPTTITGTLLTFVDQKQNPNWPRRILQNNCVVLIPDPTADIMEFIAAFTGRDYQQGTGGILFDITNVENILVGNRGLNITENTTIGVPVIMQSSGANQYSGAIEMFIPANTTLITTGNVCERKILVSPDFVGKELVQSQLTGKNIYTVFKAGINCTGTSVYFQELGQQEREVTIKIKDTALPNTGNAKIRYSNNGELWSDHGEANIFDNTIEFTTPHLTYFAIGNVIYNQIEDEEDGPVIQPQPIGGGGGGGGGITLKKDECSPIKCGDVSPSYYDDVCGICVADVPMLSGNKILEVQVSAKIGSIGGSKYSEEINQAYLWAYGLGITTMPTIQEAKVTDGLIRMHLAKMIVEFANKTLKTPLNTGYTCEFSDMTKETPEMRYYAKLACHLGIMGMNADGSPSKTFNPREKVTRAQTATILSRLLYGTTNNLKQGEQKPWYQKHIEALHTKGIIKQIDDPNREEVRGYVFIMLQRMTK